MHFRNRRERHIFLGKMQECRMKTRKPCFFGFIVTAVADEINCFVWVLFFPFKWKVLCGICWTGIAGTGAISDACSVQYGRKVPKLWKYVSSLTKFQKQRQNRKYIRNFMFIMQDFQDGFSYLWRRKWLATPVFLPGKSHGQRSLLGYSPWGHRARQGWSTFTSVLHFRYL